MRGVSPADVRAMLADGGELAILDVREELIFSQSHLLFARSAPLSRLELRIEALVPRRATRIVLCDDADGVAERAAGVLDRRGYTNLFILSGGVTAWGGAGFELFSGVNVPSKAFGEAVEHESGTPSIAAEELADLMRENADLVVLDCRPFDEYSRVSIPTAINVPGAELALRIRDIVPSPDTTVVVNCAGRTRSIIGAQSLINAGVTNKVVALRNGTMGWSLAGFECESGRERLPPDVSGDGLAWATSAAEKVADRLGIARIDGATLEQLRDDRERSLYVFDVRDPAEYAAGHVAGALSAPGGQLVQATDQYIGTLGARIVLVDDKAVRAVMTASWLRQMGWTDVFVLAESGTEKNAPQTIINEPMPQLRANCAELRALIAREEATIVDLSLSRTYLKGHIPGAWFAIRSRLAQALPKIPPRGTLVLTSEDGMLAALAAPEAQALTTMPARYLGGGNAAWSEAGHRLASDGARMADDPVDVWLKPYERGGDTRSAMAEYLSWETDLLPRIARDGSADFQPLQPKDFQR